MARRLPGLAITRLGEGTQLPNAPVDTRWSETVNGVWFYLPAQPVDATPSNALIRRCFPGRSDLFGCPQSKPSQGSVAADLTLASVFSFRSQWKVGLS